MAEGIGGLEFVDMPINRLETTVEIALYQDIETMVSRWILLGNEQAVGEEKDVFDALKVGAPPADEIEGLWLSVEDPVGDVHPASDGDNLFFERLEDSGRAACRHVPPHAKRFGVLGVIRYQHTIVVIMVDGQNEAVAALHPLERIGADTNHGETGAP